MKSWLMSTTRKWVSLTIPRQLVPRPGLEMMLVQLTSAVRMSLHPWGRAGLWSEIPLGPSSCDRIPLTATVVHNGLGRIGVSRSTAGYPHVSGNEPSLVAMRRQGGRGRARPGFAIKKIRSWKPVAEGGPL